MAAAALKAATTKAHEVRTKADAATVVVAHRTAEVVSTTDAEAARDAAVAALAPAKSEAELHVALEKCGLHSSLPELVKQLEMMAAMRTEGMSVVDTMQVLSAGQTELTALLAESEAREAAMPAPGWVKISWQTLKEKRWKDSVASLTHFASLDAAEYLMVDGRCVPRSGFQRCRCRCSAMPMCSQAPPAPLRQLHHILK
jgi:uncharacterized membrane protein YqiK